MINEAMVNPAALDPEVDPHAPAPRRRRRKPLEAAVIAAPAPAPARPAAPRPPAREGDSALVRFLARFADSGWRRAFPWAALTIVCWAFSTNIVDRANPIDLDPFIWLAGFVTTTFAFRGLVDKGGLAQIINAARAPAVG